MDTFDEAGDAHHGVAPRRGAYLFYNLRHLDGVIARLSAPTKLFFGARYAVAEEAAFTLRVAYGCNMGDAVHQAHAEQFGGNPTDHAAGATRRAKTLFGGVAHIGALEAADQPVVVLGVREEVYCQRVLVVRGRREGAQGGHSLRAVTIPLGGANGF